MLDYTELSKLSGLSRPTVMSYFDALQIAHFVFLLRPFHGGSVREIVKRPKCYSFDTGFVSFAKGWEQIRDQDRGILWEHLVLDMIRSSHPDNNIFYWQDKSMREIDFIVRGSENRIDVIECKISPDRLSTKPIKHFRELYPIGKNFCISPYIKESYSLNIDKLTINFQAFV
jgi:predicted AAA+ superfamily ATPase